MITDADVYECFSLFFSKVYGKDNYTFSPSPTDKKITAKFTQSFSGGRFNLFEYTTSAFSYYTSLNLECGLNVVQFNWVYGQKFKTRYDSIPDVERESYFNKIYRGKLGVSFELISPSTESVSMTELSPTEEKFKRLNKFTLSRCILNTTLFNPKSTGCSTCADAVDCKLMLRHKFPVIARNRKITQ